MNPTNKVFSCYSFKLFFTAGLLSLISACNTGANLQTTKKLTTPDTYFVGGTITGLDGTVILQNNGEDDLTLTDGGDFTFATKITDGANYDVSILTQPDGQTCTVSHDSGIIASADVTDVSIICANNPPHTFTVGGTVTGLSGTLVLQNNLSDDLSVSANGDFTFATSLDDGADYDVSVLTQPDGQTCTVTHGAGTLDGANVTNVAVTCATNSYTVGGAVSGLSGEVVLQNNGGDNQTINSNDSFTFTTPAAEGSPYNVTVLTQPNTQTCSVSNGSGTMGSSNVTNVSVNCATNTSTLNASVSELALSVTGATEYGVSGTPSSGVARTITVTNTGSYTVTNLLISYPAWPAGTIASSNCGSSLTASASCTITITPGNTATSDGTDPCTVGTAPIAQTITISADNADTVLSDAVILGYGCIYQGGYVYALDDTTVTSTSVGGKVAATSDQSDGILWSSNGSSSVSYVAILGIDELSTILSPSPTSPSYPLGTPAYTACEGKSDGACNTSNIVSYYNFNRASGGDAPTPLNQYAAGLCKATIDSYSDWYLPAICEEGYDDSGSGTGCGAQVTPTMQNMLSNLFDAGVGDISGEYWSSTEWVGDDSLYVWSQTFDIGNVSQFTFDKSYNTIRVRCSRALTP